MTIFNNRPNDRDRDVEFVPRKNFEFYKPIIYGVEHYFCCSCS
jgi:hypothetical protein